MKQNNQYKIEKWETILFDLDYTLIDTRELIYTCFHKLLLDYYGKELSREEIFKYIGLPYKIQLQKYTGPLSEERFHELETAHRTHQAKIFKDFIKPCPGVPEALAQLKAMGKKMGVVTSRLLPSSLSYLQTFHFDSYFSVIVTPPDTEKHKPNPDPVLKAIEKLGADPHKTVYIGDAVFDIQAGNAAGVETVYVDWEGHGFHFEEATPPTFIISDMRELLKLK